MPRAGSLDSHDVATGEMGPRGAGRALAVRAGTAGLAARGGPSPAAAATSTAAA